MLPFYNLKTLENQSYITKTNLTLKFKDGKVIEEQIKKSVMFIVGDSIIKNCEIIKVERYAII